MKRVLLDQGLAPATAMLLRDCGWDAVHVSELGLQKAEDWLVLENARSSNRVCITLDHDFHAHLAFLGSGRPSVVLLRIQGLTASGQADLIRVVWQSCEEAIDAGAAVSADLKTVRVRRLPLR